MRRSSVRQKLTILFFSILSSTVQSVFAFGEVFTNDARAFVLGDVRALSDELLNPAEIPFAEHKEAGVSVYNRFQMKELNTSALYLKVPNRWLDAGVKLSTFGYEDYRITQLQSSFAKKVSPRLSLGVQLAYFNETSILAEEAQSRFSSGLGVLYRLDDRMEWAFLCENLFSTFDENRINLSAGWSYKAVEQAVFLVETGYNEATGFRFSAGLEYEILEKLMLRAGFNTNPKTPSFGAAYQWNRWTMDVGFALHPVLGINSMIGLSVQF